MKFSYVPAYSFGRGWKAILKVNRPGTPGPGAYTPNKDIQKHKYPVWKFGKSLRDESKRPNTPGPDTYNTIKSFVHESKKPQAPKYSFGMTSGVVPRKRVFRRPLTGNKSYTDKLNSSNELFKTDNNFTSGTNFGNCSGGNNRPNSSYKKGNFRYKESLNNFNLSDGTPGVGSYNLRSSLKVPTTKFGKEKKDIAYKTTPSPGPGKLNLRDRQSFGFDAAKFSFPKSGRGVLATSFSPGPKYDVRKNAGDGSCKFSFARGKRLSMNLRSEGGVNQT